MTYNEPLPRTRAERIKRRHNHTIVAYQLWSQNGTKAAETVLARKVREATDRFPEPSPEYTGEGA